MKRAGSPTQAVSHAAAVAVDASHADAALIALDLTEASEALREEGLVLALLT